MNEEIFDALEKVAGLDIRRFAFENGFYSYMEVVDDDGNLLDVCKTLTRKDIQEVANVFCDDFDVINF